MQKGHFIILFWWHGVDVLKRVVKTLRLATCTVVRWMAKTDLYNYSKTLGGLRAGLQMKVILPGSLTTWNYLLHGWSGKGTSCGQRFESVRHGGRYLAQDSIVMYPRWT